MIKKASVVVASSPPPPHKGREEIPSLSSLQREGDENQTPPPQLGVDNPFEKNKQERAENSHPQHSEEHDLSPGSSHRNEDGAAVGDKSPVNETKRQKQGRLISYCCCYSVSFDTKCHLKVAPKEERKFDDSDSDLSSGDPTTKHNILRSTSLRKAYKNLKQQEKEEFDLVQSDASQSESESGNIPSHRNLVTPHVPGKSLLKTPKVMIQKQETISQKDRLVCITRPSILSRDSGNQLSYKGFLNLAIIILVGKSHGYV